MKIAEIEQKNSRKLLVFKIITFESRTTNSHNREQDICHWQSMYCETPLRFSISLSEIFSKSGSPIVIRENDESALMQILTRVWDSLTCWLSKGVLERCFLESVLTKFFTFCNFQNKVGMAIIFFFKMFKIWCSFMKPSQKIWTNFWF